MCAEVSFGARARSRHATAAGARSHRLVQDAGVVTAGSSRCHLPRASHASFLFLHASAAGQAKNLYGHSCSHHSHVLVFCLASARVHVRLCVASCAYNCFTVVAPTTTVVLARVGDCSTPCFFVASRGSTPPRSGAACARFAVLCITPLSGSECFHVLCPVSQGGGVG